MIAKWVFLCYTDVAKQFKYFMVLLVFCALFCVLTRVLIKTQIPGE